MKYLRPLAILALLGPAACSESDGSSAVPDGGDPAASPSPTPAPMVSPTPMPTPGPDDVCRTLGLQREPFRAGSGGVMFGDIAGDFTVNLLGGETWTLSEQWTGCESYIFVHWIRTGSPSPRYEERLWGSNPRDLVLFTQPNAHFFFASFEPTPEEREARVSNMRERIEELLLERFEDPDEQALQRRRFHYVTDQPRSVSGSYGPFVEGYIEFLQDPASRVELGDRGAAPPPIPWVLGVDRDQRWDSGGSIDEPGSGPSFRIISYLPGFYDHKARIRDLQRLQRGVDEIVLLDEEVTERIIDVEVPLPDAAQMATYDSLELDLSVFCPARNVFGCSEWDRIGFVHVCQNEDCSERLELARWITPYWRRGLRRWVMDVTALGALLRDGGTQTIRVEMGPSWERKTPRSVRLALRMRDRQSGLHPVGVERVFTGGSFGAEYNDREPASVLLPASAKRVELVTILSGHGQADGTNCAEWCDHRHQFTVNGTALDLIRHEGRIGGVDGCGGATVRGVPFGQFGNWAPARAYWCPGMPVDHIRQDITALVNLGEANTLTYEASLGEGPPMGGGNINMNSYVVWFE